MMLDLLEVQMRSKSYGNNDLVLVMVVAKLMRHPFLCLSLDSHEPKILQIDLTFPVVFLQVRTMLSGGARESRNDVLGLSIGLNKGMNV